MIKFDAVAISLISLLGGYIAAVFKTKDTKISTDKDITLKTYEILETRMKDMETKNDLLGQTIDSLKVQLTAMQKENFAKDVEYQKELEKISRKLTSTEDKLDKAIELLKANKIPIKKEIMP
ncbi:UNVERIFIED_CONTAM: hypothetical protein RF648_19655 [Kocuria sp. CPCC 205274]